VIGPTDDTLATPQQAAILFIPTLHSRGGGIKIFTYMLRKRY